MAPVSPGIKLPDTEDEKGQETDADVAKKDLILVWCCYDYKYVVRKII